METGISLGTNLGDRMANLRRARALLGAADGIRLIDTAPVYETEPVDVPDAYAAQWFLNSMMVVETRLAPDRLLSVTKGIEQRMGRDRSVEPRNGPRIIDLDIVYIGDQVIDQPGLRVPHPRWWQRAFIVRPLADLRPERVLPDGDGRPLRAVLAGLDPSGIRLHAAVPWWDGAKKGAE